MRIFMAPMEGVIDHHLRKIFKRIGGIDICVTEFVRVTDHVLPRKVFLKNCPELLNARQYCTISQHNMQVRLQLLGSNANILAANAKKAAELGAAGIDLNFGCPAKTVNRNRGGACLLDETDLLYDIVSKVRTAVPDPIPVTAKIRLGYMDRNSYMRNAYAIEAAGANELIVHARSKKDGYNPPAYWLYINEIRKQLSIPVVANGEIWTLNDYHQCQTESGCDDVMLGRGLLANPGLASSIKSIAKGRLCQEMPWQKVAPLLYDFFQETSFSYPKKFMGNRVKQWLHYLQKNYLEARRLFETIKRSRDFNQLNDAILQSHDY